MNSSWIYGWSKRGFRKGAWLISRRRFHGYEVVQCTENILTSTHQFTSMPWWVVIGGTTVLLSTVVMSPLLLYQHKIIAKIELLQPLIKEYAEVLKHNVVVKCKREGLPSHVAIRRLKIEMFEMTSELYSREGCHPLKLTVLPWTQIPLWILISLSLRNMSRASPASGGVPSVPSLSTEGVMWFSDLTAPDPLYILPVLLMVSNLVYLEINVLKMKKEQTFFQNLLTNLFRVLSLCIGVVATQLPTAITFYWTTSSTFSLAQNLLFMSPQLRRALGLPKTPSESKNPYQDLLKNLKARTNLFLRRQREGRSRK